MGTSGNRRYHCGNRRTHCRYYERTYQLAVQPGDGQGAAGLYTGAMTAFDMGGPVNKVATLFAHRHRWIRLPYGRRGRGYLYTAHRHGIATCWHQEVQCMKRKQKGSYLMDVGTARRSHSVCGQRPLRVIRPDCGSRGRQYHPIPGRRLNHAPWGDSLLPVEGRIGTLLQFGR